MTKGKKSAFILSFLMTACGQKQSVANFLESGLALAKTMLQFRLEHPDNKP
jgi:hypothetical protein